MLNHQMSHVPFFETHMCNFFSVQARYEVLGRLDTIAPPAMSSTSGLMAHIRIASGGGFQVVACQILRFIYMLESFLHIMLEYVLHWCKLEEVLGLLIRLCCCPYTRLVTHVNYF